MADIGIAFHWPPSELWEMELSELAMWRRKAAARMPKKAK